MLSLFRRTIDDKIRLTEDVDCVIEIKSRSEYYDLEEKLRRLGIKEPREETHPLCRWVYSEITVDIMPTNEKIISFSNKWYKDGRGRNDFLRSSDREDIVALVDGCENLIEKIKRAAPEVRSYLRTEIQTLLKNARFVEAVHVQIESIDPSGRRVQRALTTLSKLAECNSQKE